MKSKKQKELSPKLRAFQEDIDYINSLRIGGETQASVLRRVCSFYRKGNHK